MMEVGKPLGAEVVPAGGTKGLMGSMESGGLGLPAGIPIPGEVGLVGATAVVVGLVAMMELVGRGRGNAASDGTSGM
jgi:hypothetical protein